MQYLIYFAHGTEVHSDEPASNTLSIALSILAVTAVVLAAMYVLRRRAQAKK